MGDGNRVRQGAAWTANTATHVRQGAAWTPLNRIWSREGVQWRLVQTTDQTPILTCFDQYLCQAGGDPGCDTLTDCTFQGEIHRLEWDYTGASTGYHLSIHVSVGGGSYVESADAIALNNGEEDAGCCEFIKAKDCSGDNSWIITKNKSSDLGSCTTTFQYRGRIEIDGSDTLVGSAITHGSASTGCDVGCIA